jgi:hypothetical protein
MIRLVVTTPANVNDTVPATASSARIFAAVPSRPIAFHGASAKTGAKEINAAGTSP